MLVIIILAEHLPLAKMNLSILRHWLRQKLASNTVILLFWVPVDSWHIVQIEYDLYLIC